MKMTIVREDNEFTQIALAGSLDTQGVAQIETQFHAHAEDRKLSVIIDLSGVTFIMSRGITMLAQCTSALKKYSKKTIILNPQPYVLEVLKNVALDKIILIVHDQAQAEQFARS